MKKCLLLALGCGLVLSMTACGSSDEEVAEDACWHMLKCEMPLYSEARCNAINSDSKKDSEDTKSQKVKDCKKAQRDLHECQADAPCESLKKGTVCVTEAAVVIDKCVAEVFKD